MGAKVVTIKIWVHLQCCTLCTHAKQGPVSEKIVVWLGTEGSAYWAEHPYIYCWFGLLKFPFLCASESMTCFDLMFVCSYFIVCLYLTPLHASGLVLIVVKNFTFAVLIHISDHELTRDP